MKTTLETIHISMDGVSYAQATSPGQRFSVELD
jgi:hypothetical protein